MTFDAIKHEFVDAIPEKLAERTLYVCIDYATAVHKCCCGCGEEVVTPFSPTDWKITFDGVSVSLMPSIGNWSFACQSHYWIVNDSIRWAGSWSPDQIAAGRRRDQLAKQGHLNLETKSVGSKAPEKTLSVWQKIRTWLSRYWH